MRTTKHTKNTEKSDNKINFVFSIIKFFLVVPLALLAACSTPKSHSTVQFHVRDFGAVPSSPNVRLALEAAVKAAAKVKGPAEILFEPNAVYRISLPDELADQSKHAWLIKNATNLTINGQGATLLVTNPEIGAISTEK